VQRCKETEELEDRDARFNNYRWNMTLAYWLLYLPLSSAQYRLLFFSSFAILMLFLGLRCFV